MPSSSVKPAAIGKPKQDCRFRVFKLAESNFKPWDAEVAHDEKALAQQLELHIDHIREGRTQEERTSSTRFC